MRIIYYSYAATEGHAFERQWVQSIRSLRLHNASIPVFLFLYNDPSAEILLEAARRDVRVTALGQYKGYLKQITGKDCPTLASCPTLHKFLALSLLSIEHPSQLLYVDGDTFFLGDVAVLFDRYYELDFYAREEPHSRRSNYGYDPKYLNEEVLSALAVAEGLVSVPPYNTGVCLMNNAIWNKLSVESSHYLDYAARLLTGLQTMPFSRDQQERYPWLHTASVSPIDRLRLLEYPSANPWIVDEIALWLTLGRLATFSHGMLSPTDIAQNGEILIASAAMGKVVIAHYFRRLEGKFFERFQMLDANLIPVRS